MKKLQRREKILVGLTLGLVCLAGLWFLLFSGDSRSDDQLLAEQTKLESEIENKQKQIDSAVRDRKRLTDWQRRALPADPVLARSLYQNWLRGLTARTNLHGTTLVANEAGARHDQLTRISFNLHAQAKLGDLVEFLYEFYSAGYLHQIRDMTIKPMQGARELDLKLTIEAVSLPTAESKDQLPKEAGSLLKFAKLSEYRPIISRDFFAGYVRPIPVSPPRRERTIDPAEFAVVTAFTEVDGAAQVWLQDRMAPPQGKLWKLGTGESFAVGNVKGTVQSIRPEGEAIVEFDGHRRLLHVGDNLYGGAEVQADRPNQPKEGDNSVPPAADPGN